MGRGDCDKFSPPDVDRAGSSEIDVCTVIDPS